MFSSGRRSDADHEAPAAPPAAAAPPCPAPLPRAPAAQRPLSRARRTPGAGARGPQAVRATSPLPRPLNLIPLSWN